MQNWNLANVHVTWSSTRTTVILSPTSTDLSKMLELQASSVLVLILCVLAIKHLVAALGKPYFQNHAWNVYTTVASRAGHPKFVGLSEKRAELLRISKERKSISAQDEYARWTKLTRQVDKLLAEITEISNTMSSDKAQVARIVGYAITASTAAPIWFSRLWYRKVVLFYFPGKVLPGALEWFLALPFIVQGGVGLTVWMFAVNSVLLSVELLILFLVETPIEKPVETVKETKVTEAN